MVQGGDPLTKNHDPRDDGRGNPGFTIEDEFTDYPHLRGTVSMANTGTPYSAGSQFFIVLADSRQLDGQYTAFGRVTRGMEVADAIAALEIDRYGRYGPPNRPYPVSAVVETVRIEAADAPVDVAQREDGVAR
jgi:cyclophilin family peptidyl-prolyl cis-trans isomerase